MKDDKIVVLRDDGTEFECDVYLFCRDDETGKDYVVYSDNTEDEEGNLNVFASIIEVKGSKALLFPIETEEEWAQIEAIIKENQQ